MKKVKHLSREFVDSLPKLKAPAGYVYVMQEMKFGEDFKIGFTKHPATRVSRFEVILPFEVKPVLVIESFRASAAETLLHRRFKRKHVNGEWYSLSEADIQTISELNIDRIVKKKQKSASTAKKKPKRARRRKHFKDSGWSENDWSDGEWMGSDSEDYVEADDDLGRRQ